MARRSDYIPEEHIESAAMELLVSYGRKFGAVTAPPVPVDEILEAHLGLVLDLDDLPALLGKPGVLGATWVQTKRVVIDQSLDPSEFPERLGRYRFTVSHEIGHWELHRQPYVVDPAQGRLFDDGGKPSIVCRAGTKDRKEWQADCFAGHLLMPREMVLRAWKKQQGAIAPYIAVDEIADMTARWGLGDDERPTVQAARDLAQVFHVSGQAMQIRLIGLGLIKTEKPEPGQLPGLEK